MFRVTAVIFISALCACNSADTKNADTAEPDTTSASEAASVEKESRPTAAPTSSPADSTSNRPATATFTIKAPEHTQAYAASGSYSMKGTAISCGFVQDGMMQSTPQWSFSLTAPVNGGDGGEITVTTQSISAGATTSDLNLVVDIGKPGGKLKLVPSGKASSDTGSLTLIEHAGGRDKFKIEGTTYDKVQISIDGYCDPAPAQ